MKFSKSTNVAEQCSKSADTLKTFLDKQKIPPQVLAKAAGIAIFTAFRAGMYFAGTAGSGVLLSRLPDGTWSPPSAFTVRSGSVGIVYGVDVFDCVLVFNEKEAITQYLSSEMQLGGGVKLAAGPVGGNANTADVKPVLTYTRSKQILEGDVKEQSGPGGAAKWPAGAKGLMDLLRNVDASVQTA